MKNDINEILKTAANNGASTYGAQMGRTNHCDGAPEALYLQKVRFVDGDYDTGGAYWGGGPGSEPLWCAFSPADTNNEDPIRIFVRARTRYEAKLAVLAEVKEDGFTFIDDDVTTLFLAYVTCALWSTNDDEGNPLDDNRDIDDIDPEAYPKDSLPMKIPHELSTCPNCGKEAFLKYQDRLLKWTDKDLVCPHCDTSVPASSIVGTWQRFLQPVE